MNKLYIEHRPSGKIIKLQETNINSFSVKKKEFSLLNAVTHMSQSNEAIIQPIKSQLLDFIEKFTDYHKFFSSMNTDSRLGIFAPRHLSDKIDPNDNNSKIFSDVSNFTAFYEKTLNLQASWELVAAYFNDKNRKKEITDKLSKKFQEWGDVYEFTYYDREGLKSVAKDKDPKPTAYSPYSRDNAPPTVLWQHPDGQKVKAYLDKRHLYHPDSISVVDYVALDVFNIYDLISCTANKNPLAKIIDSDIFRYPLSDYGLSEAPGLVVSKTLSLYAVAVRNPKRTPQDAWLRRTGHGRQIFTSLCDSLSEATSYTNLAEASEAAKNMCTFTIEAVVVEFESTPVKARPVSTLKSLSQSINAHIEKDKITDTLETSIPPAVGVTQTSQARRNKI